MKYILLLAIFCMPAAAQVTTTYDKPKDLTIVESKWRVPKNASVTVSARCAFRGSVYKAGTSEAFFLIVGSQAIGWQFMENNGFTAKADGTRIDLGNANHQGQSDRLSRTNLVAEIMTWQPTRAQFQSIAGGRKVEVKVGKAEFQLDDKTLADLKAVLAGCTASPATQ